MSVFLKIDILRGQESNYFNRPKYLVKTGLYTKLIFLYDYGNLTGYLLIENLLFVKYLNTPV